MTININIANEIGESVDYWNGVVGGVTAERVAAKFVGRPATEPVEVYINSVGGDAVEALAIYRVLHNWRGRVTVIIGSVAAGAAAWIAMAGDVVQASERSTVALIAPHAFIDTTSVRSKKVKAELAELRDAIATAFLQRSSRLSRKEFLAALDAETWYLAEEAMQIGLVDEIIRDPAPVLSVQVSPRFFLDALVVTGDVYMIPSDKRMEWDDFDIACEEANEVLPIPDWARPLKSMRDVEFEQPKMVGWNS